MSIERIRPRVGSRVQLRYNPRTRDWIGLHEATGTVLAIGYGRGPKGRKSPTNALVLLDGEATPRVIPRGQLFKEP